MLTFTPQCSGSIPSSQHGARPSRTLSTLQYCRPRAGPGLAPPCPFEGRSAAHEGGAEGTTEPLSPEADHGSDLGENVLQLLLRGLVRDVPHCGRETAALSPRSGGREAAEPQLGQPGPLPPPAARPSPKTERRERSTAGSRTDSPAMLPGASGRRAPLPVHARHRAPPHFRPHLTWRRRNASGKRSGGKRRLVR